MSSRFRRFGLAVVILVSGVGFASAAQAQPKPNKPAPGFTAETAAGQTISLAQFRGQPVILEWTNHLCPFVQKHYDTGNMQALQTAMVEQGAVWISVISSAPGKQGQVDADKALALTREREAAPSHVVLDPGGELGRLYRARATPHMFLIDSGGLLRYMGAIDDQPSANPATVKSAENYVKAAWTAVQKGDKPATQATRAYGCSVKY